MRNIIIGAALMAVAGCATKAVIDNYSTDITGPAAPTKTYVVYFESGKFQLTPEAKITLDGVANLLIEQRFTELGVDLVGATDSTGSVDMNYALGMRRAEVVRNYLFEKGVGLFQVSDPQSVGEAGVTGVSSKDRKVELKTILFFK